MHNPLASAIEFDQGDLDAALGEFAIHTVLPVDTQRHLAARVLITSSLAAAIPSDEEYALAVAELGEPPEGHDEINFVGEFSRGLVRDLNSEMGEDISGNADFAVLVRRVGALSASGDELRGTRTPSALQA